MSQERVDNLFASESWTAVYTAFTNVSLKAYDFDTIREALIDYVSITYPDKFNDFISSSEFVAVLDLVAYLGHSLSFRLDMNTRENFLDTAERRESVLRMAKTLGYNKTRPTNARGFLKITSVTTNQPIADNEGNSLANRTINWNDSNNADWYENFIDIINASLTSTSKIQDPMASMVLSGIENYLYEINQSDASRAVSFSFEAPVSGANRRFEAVRTEFKDDKIIEAEPIETKKFTIINRNDNLGPASDRTGFFVYAKTGKLNFENFTYNTKVSNVIETIASANISNTDVWVQRVDTTNTYSSSVTKVDNDTRETAIYNSLRNGNGDIVSVNTIDNNAVELHYGDGVFGNAASGNYRVWFRTTDNENYRVDRNDVNEKVISIPYTGADKKNYRLVLTLSSTRDFSENFAAESYTSVRRIAPRSYYSQDRMVNAQDYNVLPLSLGSNIISKVKAVNTTFAGKSRYFEMDDVTGHHSNISITGTDGAVYSDADDITMKLSFNRQNGNTTDFVRNEITKALRHPSLINLFYEINKDDAKIELVPAVDFTVDPANKKFIDTGTTMDESVWPGDFVKLELGADDYQWTSVYYGESAPVANSKFQVTSSVKKISGTIDTIVRGYRTRLEVQEITAIKNKIAESDDDIVLKYVVNDDATYTAPAIGPYIWKIHDAENDAPLVEGQDVFVTLSYNSGIRESEAEYKIKFTGRKIVFSSTEQIKFYYGNEDLVVDNETNLAERDKLLINYYNGDRTETIINDTITKYMTIGSAPIDSESYNQVGDSAEFDALFKYTGADQNLEFLQDDPNPTGVILKPTNSTSHYLVSPVGVEYPTTPELDANGDIPIIGSAPDYRLSFNITDTTGLVGETNTIETDSEVSDSDLYVLPALGVSIETGDTGNASSSQSTTISTSSLSFNTLKETGLKGTPSMDYFNEAEEHFIWIDENELPSGVTNETAEYPQRGTQKAGVIYSNNVFEFQFAPQDGWRINYLDNENAEGNGLAADVRWKQFAYSKIVFSSTDTLSAESLLLRESDGNFISSDHWEMTVNGNQYTITFWTYDPQIGSLIDVLTGTGESVDLSTFTVRVESAVEVKYKKETVIQTYDDISSFVYDDFITKAGYVDNTKVKLLHMDSEKDPYGITNIYSGDNPGSIVLEEYTLGDKKFERVSEIASAVYGGTNGVVLENFDELSDTTTLVFNLDTGKWYRRSNVISEDGSSNWVEAVYDEIDGVKNIRYGYVSYRVVEGRSYVEDKFMSFRWDHFADADKRIDPSTSNIIDMYVLTEDYVRNIDEWILGGFGDVIPTPPNNFELRKIMEPLEDKTAIADHVSYIPVKFKMLFGSYAEAENQAVFKVISKLGTTYTDSEIKSTVSAKVNEYFKLENWDFGDQFYFSELASYLHQELADYISSVIITPKFSGNDFKNLLSISCEPNEIFLSVVTSKDVKIISSIADNELTGE